MTAEEEYARAERAIAHDVAEYAEQSAAEDLPHLVAAALAGHRARLVERAQTQASARLDELVDLVERYHDKGLAGALLVWVALKREGL